MRVSFQLYKLQFYVSHHRTLLQNTSAHFIGDKNDQSDPNQYTQKKVGAQIILPCYQKGP